MTVRIDAARRTRFGVRDIAGLIRIYEANYVRLTKLVPESGGMRSGDGLACRGSPRPASRNHRASAVHDFSGVDVSVRGPRRLCAGTECTHQRLPRRSGGGSRFPLPPAQELRNSPVDSRAHAGAGSQVANESVSSEVAQILYVPGTSLPSRCDPCPGRMPSRFRAPDVHRASISSHPLNTAPQSASRRPLIGVSLSRARYGPRVARAADGRIRHHRQSAARVTEGHSVVVPGCPHVSERACTHREMHASSSGRHDSEVRKRIRLASEPDYRLARVGTGGIRRFSRVGCRPR